MVTQECHKGFADVNGKLIKDECESLVFFESLSFHERMKQVVDAFEMSDVFNKPLKVFIAEAYESGFQDAIARVCCALFRDLPDVHGGHELRNVLHAASKKFPIDPELD